MRMRLLGGLLFALLLVSCGGGGSGADTSASINQSAPPIGSLVTIFGYPQQSLVEFSEARSLPSLSSHGDAAMHFSVIGGTLPAGMTLDSATGAIYGAPADTTMTTATISLVVDGYSGSLTTVFNQLIQKPGLTLVDAENAGIFRIQVAAPLPSGAHVALSDPRDYGVLSVAQGVAVAYSLLPQSEVAPGVTFDTQTGSLTGTPSTPGTYSMLVGATVSYEGRSDTTGKSITLVVEDPAVRLSYTPSISGGYDMCVSSPAVPFASIPPGGYPVRFVPSFQGTLPGDMFSDFQATSNYAASAPLQTLSLDPITGVISGNAFAPNNYCKAGFMDFTVSFTLTRGAFTKRLTQNFWFSN